MQIVQNIYSKRWLCKLVLSFKAGNDAGVFGVFLGGGVGVAPMYIFYICIFYF